jgi:hypothetical protein
MYKNNLESFKKWCADHKTFMDSDIKKTEYFNAYGKSDNLYFVELNKIQIREMSNKPFVGEAIYRYDPYKKDFIHISKYNTFTEKEYYNIMERLQLTIKDFKERNEISDSDYLPFAVNVRDNIWTLKRKHFPKRPNGIICPNCGNRDLYPSKDKNPQSFCERFYCWSTSELNKGCRAEINIIDME